MTAQGYSLQSSKLEKTKQTTHLVEGNYHMKATEKEIIEL